MLYDDERSKGNALASSLQSQSYYLNMPYVFRNTEWSCFNNTLTPDNKNLNVLYPTLEYLYQDHLYLTIGHETYFLFVYRTLMDHIQQCSGLRSNP